jgi:hypothetical protein
VVPLAFRHRPPEAGGISREADSHFCARSLL